MFDMVSPKSSVAAVSMFKKVMDKKNAEEEFTLRRKDGSLVRVRVNGVPIVVDGKVTGVTGVMKLLGEEKKRK